MSRHMTTVLFTMSLALLMAAPAYAQKGRGDEEGMGRRAEKPPIEHIHGTLERMETGPCPYTTGRAYIGTHLFVRTGDDQLLNVHLGSAEAVKAFVDKLEAGQEVEIEGFQTDKLEADHYIAQSVTAGEQSLQLRDENLRPFWAGDRDRRRERRERRSGEPDRDRRRGDR